MRGRAGFMGSPFPLFQTGRSFLPNDRRSRPELFFQYEPRESVSG